MLEETLCSFFEIRASDKKLSNCLLEESTGVVWFGEDVALVAALVARRVHLMVCKSSGVERR